MRYILSSFLLIFLFNGYAYAKEIVIIVGFPHPAKKLELLTKAAEEEGVKFNAIYLRRMEDLQSFQIPEADVYLVDSHGDEMRVALKKILEDRNYYILSRPPDGKDKRLLQEIYDYYESGGRENFKNMFRMLLGREAQPPKKLPLNGFYLKGEGVFEEIPIYYREKSPVVITFHRADLVSEDTAILDSLIGKLEEKGITAVGFFYNEFEGLGKNKEKLIKDMITTPSLIVNLRLMFMNYEEERKALEELGILTIGGHVFRGKFDDWYKSSHGIPIPSLPFYYTVQEYMGIIDLTVIGYEEKSKKAIDFMIENFASRLYKWIKLKEMENSKKKVAVIYYNYPPGKSNISAANLNVTRSIELLLREAKSRGYSVNTMSEDELRKYFTEAIGFYYGDTNSKPQTKCLSIDYYVKWFSSLPQVIRDDVIRVWGEPAKDSFIRDGCFLIPVLELQNFVFIPLAPRGSRDSDNKNLYHSTKIPPSHYYLAFYLYIQRNFDVLIHFGTHGTQEWTPGKDRALSFWDYPYLTLGDIPVVYPYVVDNLGEAVNAKRRGRAVIVSHQTPAFAPTGTYGEIEEIHQLIHKESYTEGRQKEILRRTIAQRAIKSRIAFDLGYRSIEQILHDFENFSKSLHDHIHEIASQNTPLGLHTFGKIKEDELIFITILQMLGKEWVKKWENIDYSEFLSQPIDRIKSSKAFQMMTLCLKENLDECKRVKEFYEKFDAKDEMNSIFLALDGKYIKTSYGGDPIRNPDSLPTGRNLYSFDPSRVPTEFAWKTAVELTDEMLKEYKTKHGDYPKKIAFSLWSTETMRHFGVTEAQVLYLMGVKPKWDQGGIVIGVEIIPKEELKRPRIDVVVSATGLYRDHFPNLMALINYSSQILSRLEEEDNFVANNTKRIKRYLMEKGIEESEATKLSVVRSFTNETGAYGTGLDGALSTQRDRKSLSSIFIQRMSFMLRDDGNSQRVEGLFEENLKETEVVLFSRSSNLYGLLSSDDPFQYLGGLAMAVEIVSGKRPDVLISNLRSTAKIQRADAFLVNEMRSRYLNPEWIKSMIKEGASGVTTVLDTVNNLYGWQVVTPQVVKNYLWKELKEVYLEDKYKLKLREWFRKNPEALKALKERIFEGMKVAGYGLSKGGSKVLVQSQQFSTIKGNVLEKVNLEETLINQADLYEVTPLIHFVLVLVFMYLYGFYIGFKRKSYA